MPTVAPPRFQIPVNPSNLNVSIFDINNMMLLCVICYILSDLIDQFTNFTFTAK